MSRPLRIEYANAFYHVMNRGAARKATFKNDAEMELFISLLSEAHSQFNIEIHAYCLMTNHYHLLIKTPLANLSRAMRHINGVYTQRYNRLNQTDGPLFRGRFKAILVDSDAYLLHLTKYIHLNPLEARIVDHLNKYKWSSYEAFIGLCATPPWLFTAEVYSQLNKTSNHGEHYKYFMEHLKCDSQVTKFYSKERVEPVLGRESFKLSLPSLNQSIEIPRGQRQINRPSINLVVEQIANILAVSIDSILNFQKGRGRKNCFRKMAMFIIYKKYNFQLSEIALAFNLKHYGAVTNAIAYIKHKTTIDVDFSNFINSIIMQLEHKSK